MSQLAFGITAAMLTFWASGLFLSLQHVSDRYSPVMMTVIMRRPIFWIPFVLLAGCMLAAGVLAVLPASSAIDIVALAITMLSIVIALVSVYALIHALSNAAVIVSWLRGRVPKNQKGHGDIREEVVLSAIRRDDRRTARAMLQQSFGPTREPSEERDLLTWLEQRPELVTINWFARELLDALLSEPFDAATAESRVKLLQALVSEALNSEEYTRGRAFVIAILRTLTNQAQWRSAFGHIVESVGFALWRIGDEEASRARTSTAMHQLRDVQDAYFAELKRAWNHVFPRDDAHAAYAFTLAILGILQIVDENDESAISWVLSIIYDILEDGYRHDLLARDTLLELANALGRLDRALPTNSDDLRNWVDDLNVTIAALYITILDRSDLASARHMPDGESTPSEIPGVAIIHTDDDTSPLAPTGARDESHETQKSGNAHAAAAAQPVQDEEEEKEHAERMFRHLLMNSGLHRRVTQGKKLTPRLQPWIPAVSYDAVARELGIPSFRED